MTETVSESIDRPSQVSGLAEKTPVGKRAFLIRQPGINIKADAYRYCLDRQRPRFFLPDSYSPIRPAAGRRHGKDEWMLSGQSQGWHGIRPPVRLIWEQAAAGQ